MIQVVEELTYGINLYTFGKQNIYEYIGTKNISSDYMLLLLSDDRIIHCDFENNGDDEIYTDDCRLVPVNISDVSERWVKVSGADDTPYTLKCK